MPVREEIVAYTDGETTMHGLVAFPDVAEPAPAVIVAPMWSGRTQFADDAARRFAARGWVGFALDPYGEGRVGTTPDENRALMGPLVSDRALLLRRARAAVDAVAALPQVDASRVAAIGFCFGGLVVLDLARGNAPVRGVASFHGLLGGNGLEQPEPIATAVLILHGHDDPMATPDDVAAVQRELDARAADWQIHVYGDTVHAFTNPTANSPEGGTVYSARAARRAWAACDDFLAEVLGAGA
jgi:dienelactone hydrolase